MRMLAIIAALAAIVITSRADDPPRIRVLTQSWDVNQTSDRKSMPISIYQGERVELTITAKRGGALITIPSNAAPVWTIHDWDVTGTWLTITGTVSATATGVLEYVIQPAQSGGLPPGSYRAYCTVTGGVIAAQSLVVLASSLATDYPTLEYVNAYLGALAATESNIAAESSARFAGDAVITTALAQTAATLESNITAESSARIAADEATSNALTLISATLGSNINAEATARADADAAFSASLLNVESNAIVSVEFAGGWYNPDWFTLSLKPYHYHVIHRGDTQTMNTIYVSMITVDSASGYLLDPAIMRTSDFTGAVSFAAMSNCVIESVVVTNYFLGEGITQNYSAVIFDELEPGAYAGVSATLNAFTRTTSVVYAVSNTYSYYRYEGDVPGTARAYVNTSLAARATASGKVMDIYEAGWPSNWIRNTNCWIYGHDFTCASPWNTQGNQPEKGGTAITRQHIAYADHYSFTNQAQLLFVDSTNGTHWRSIIDQRTIAGTDVRIGLLDEPLPQSITPAQLLHGADAGRFLGGLDIDGSAGIRTVHFKAVGNPYPKVFAKYACYGFAYIDGRYGIIGSADAAIGRSIPDHPYSAGAMVGDSGQPCFILCGTNTVLYSTFRGSMGGPNYAYLASAIEEAIADMGRTEHTDLYYVDLTAWRDFNAPPLP